MPVDVLKTRVVLFSKPRKMIMVIATITTSTASSPRSGQSVEKRSLEGKWIKLLARGVGRFLNDSRVWTRAFVQLEWRAHVCGAISRKSICGSFPDKAEFEKCRGRKKNVTRAKRGKKFIYTDFNSTFVFIRDSSVSNEFHDTFRTFETFSYRDLRVYGTLNSRKNVYIYIYFFWRARTTCHLPLPRHRIYVWRKGRSEKSSLFKDHGRVSISLREVSALWTPVKYAWKEGSRSL